MGQQKHSKDIKRRPVMKRRYGRSSHTQYFAWAMAYDAVDFLSTRYYQHSEREKIRPTAIKHSRGFRCAPHVYYANIPNARDARLYGNSSGLEREREA